MSISSVRNSHYGLLKMELNILTTIYISFVSSVKMWLEERHKILKYCGVYKICSFVQKSRVVFIILNILSPGRQTFLQSFKVIFTFSFRIWKLVQSTSLNFSICMLLFVNSSHFNLWIRNKPMGWAGVVSVLRLVFCHQQLVAATELNR